MLIVFSWMKMLRFVEYRAAPLLDGNAARLVLLGLGHCDVQDAVAEVSGDAVLVHARGEVEGARGLASVARISLVDRSEAILLLSSVLDSGLVRLGRLGTAGDGLLVGLVLHGRCASGRGAGSVGALNLAADEHVLGVCELNVDILLGHAGEFAVELVRLSSLANVKLGREGSELRARARRLAAIVGVLTAVAVKVVKEAEERSEGGVVGGGVEVAWEEGHCVGCWLEWLFE